MSNPQLFDDPAAGEPKPKPKKTCTPDRIGSGPPGETCKTCKHKIKVRWHDKTYHKCGLMGKYWTHGGGSDIKLKWAACSFWEDRHLEWRVMQLGEYAEQCIAGRGWFREPLLVVADYYEETGLDMGWLRHAASKIPSMKSEIET